MGSVRLLASRATSVDDDRAAANDNVLQRAATALQAAEQQDQDAFYAAHVAACASLYSSRIEVDGNTTLAAIVNASLYGLMTALRGEVTYSTSPGGLATNTYHGHTFWDVETWMWPTLNLFYPDIALSVLTYRSNRLGAAESIARSHHMDGAMFPWESAFTGQETDPAPGTLNEEHIQGDIAFAFRQYFQATGDGAWLNSTGYDVLAKVAAFWASKAQRNSDGSYSIPDIMGPDEYHGGVTDSVYCNVIAQLSLQTAHDWAARVGRAPNATLQTIAQNLRVLFNASTGIHPEYLGYDGSTVKQADTILIGYPLGYNMTAAVRAADLNYYRERTDPHGPAMTWGMFSIGYRDVGLAAEADDFFQQSFEGNLVGPFLRWAEVKGGGGAFNFITGAGGFLQTVWAGYGGARLTDDVLELRAPSPLPGSTGLLLRGLAYQGGRFTVEARQSPAGWTLTLAHGGDASSFELAVVAAAGVIPTPDQWQPLPAGQPQAFQIGSVVLVRSKSA
ncbi:uncharacterized protein MONBRDRAFT_16873 [Monosiga brevicollis MX1]|uniref:Glycoside hydrolase family 65 central catalytic domain-containing protein n=1 Tax=Monosiga brevicollis TaxID=81824 RepID=A9UXV0_MONBE|nr:uncharacterized protein MONBRDRAFT_16873 [Monosiga brevicollis MX1]EDQ89749.1 predicted protein [Monosiga brevicollis MX1]|eukprot:XP_001745171.1 hypothetical protein [Monosiga brevicollis MX1]